MLTSHFVSSINVQGKCEILGVRQPESSPLVTEHTGGCVC